MRQFPSDRVRTMVLWKQSRLGLAKPSTDFRGSVYVQPFVRGDVGGRPGVVAVHGIDLSDGSLDIDGREGPERRLGGCLLLQTTTSPPNTPSDDASVGVLYVLWLSLPYLSSSIGERGQDVWSCWSGGGWWRWALKRTDREEKVEDVRVQSSCWETARHPASERLITSPPALVLSSSSSSLPFPPSEHSSFPFVVSVLCRCSHSVREETLIEANWTHRGFERSIKFPLDVSTLLRGELHAHPAFQCSSLYASACKRSV